MVQVTNAPGFMVGAVTGMASLEPRGLAGRIIHQFFWTQKEIADLACSTTVSCMDIALRRGAGSPDKWDWRVFSELVGERSNRFLQGGSALAGTKANQKSLRPSALGIYDNYYAISFGAQLDISDELGFPSPDGTILDPDNLCHRYLHPALTEAGLRKIRLHDPRHSFGSLLIQSDLDRVREGANGAQFDPGDRRYLPTPHPRSQRFVRGPTG